MSAPSCQQDLVYAAERNVPWGNRFRSLEEVQRFYDDLRETWWWAQNLQMVHRVEVGPTRKNATAHVGWYEPDMLAGRCEFITSQPAELVVVHELSHVIASARHHSKSHDPWFARTYLELTYLARGSADSWALMKEFTHLGVDFDAPSIIKPAIVVP